MKISKHPDVRGVVRITGKRSGPRVVIFSGVHGNEVSGVHAIDKLLFDLLGGSKVLERGTLTVARGNEMALEAERRYLKHNLNRLFRPNYGPEVDKTSYEYHRAQELKSLIQDCDYFLDLHSAPTAQDPFLVAERASVQFFSKLGISRIMTGWSKFSSGPIGGDAENYAASYGAKSATLESGSHFDKRSNDVAYKAVLTFLSLLGMIEATKQPSSEQAELYDVYSVVTKDFPDFRYTTEVKNFGFFGQGETFAVQGGRPMTAAEDTYLLIPMKPEETRIGEEVCYLGRRLSLAVGPSAG